MLRGATKDKQIISSSWHKLQAPIDGLTVREVTSVPGNRGMLTEIFRPGWDPGGGPVEQIFQIRLFPGTISAWHCHLKGVDRLFIGMGHVRIVVFDARPDSSGHGAINQFHIGESRPALLVIPPQVWHGTQNVGGTPALLLNAPTHAYDYEDPDHYRLPWNTSEIPFSWDVDPMQG